MFLNSIQKKNLIFGIYGNYYDFSISQPKVQKVEHFLTNNNIIEIEKKSLSIIREYFTHYPISSFELSSKFHLLSADYPIFQRLPIIRFLSENSAYYPFG